MEQPSMFSTSAGSDVVRNRKLFFYVVHRVDTQIECVASNVWGM